MKKNNIPLNFREKNNSRISLLCSAAVLIVLVFLMHQLDYGLITKPEEKAAQEAQKKEEEAKKAAETPEITTASVIAVGDNLYHSKLYESGEYDSGTWNYDHIYANVLDEIQAADVLSLIHISLILIFFKEPLTALVEKKSEVMPKEKGMFIVQGLFEMFEVLLSYFSNTCLLYTS